MKEQMYHKKEKFPHIFRAVCVLLLLSPICLAKPDMTPLGPKIADKGSEFYHFSVSRFDSLDGKRHYKVWIGVPDKKPPVSGFPVLYMLDGNAVMDRLSDDLLKKYLKKRPRLLLLSDIRLNCLLSQHFVLMTILLQIKNRTVLIVMVEKEEGVIFFG